MANTPVEIRIKPSKGPTGPVRVRVTQVDAGGRYSLSSRQMTLDEALEDIVTQHAERADKLGLGEILTPPIGLADNAPNSGVD